MPTLYIDKQTRTLYGDLDRTKPVRFMDLLPTQGAGIPLVLAAFDAHGPTTLSSLAVTIGAKAAPTGGSIVLSYDGTELESLDISGLSAATLASYLNGSSGIATAGGVDVVASGDGSWFIQARSVGAMDALAVASADLIPLGTATVTSVQAGDADEHQIWKLKVELGIVANLDSWTQSSSVTATITELISGGVGVSEVQRIAFTERNSLRRMVDDNHGERGNVTYEMGRIC